MTGKVRLGFCLLVWMLLTAVAWSHPDSPGFWIAVTAPDYVDDLEPLCRQRRQQGFKVVVVEAGKLYKQNDALDRRATSIHAFLEEQYRAFDGPVYVVLAGAISRDPSEGFMSTHLASPLGRSGRMQGKPSDALYGFMDDEYLSRVTVGRLPARNQEEMQGMVAKILRYEQNGEPGPWNHRLSVLAGNPGGATPMQRSLAEQLIQAVGRERLARVHSSWVIQGLIHAKGSPFYVPDADLNTESRALLERGQAFFFYLGHSGPAGVSSEGMDIMTRSDFGQLNIAGRQGIFFSCGCYAMALKGDYFFGWKTDQDGYAWAAMRNPYGPVAVMGAAATSNAIFGQVGFDQMMTCLSQAEPPRRLGRYWQAVQEGITCKPINSFLFRLYDNADGSGGKVPLAEQRKEHLEMWSLLGDPAMLIPMPAQEIEITDVSALIPGRPLQVTGIVDRVLDGGRLIVVLERRFEDVFQVWGQFDESQPLFQQANDVVIAETRGQIQNSAFNAEITLPDGLPFQRVVLRICVDSGDRRDMAEKLLAVKSAGIVSAEVSGGMTKP